MQFPELQWVERIYEIVAVIDQWYEPSATYFKVQSIEGKTYLLRYDEREDEWTLKSGFDGDELLMRPSIELVTVDPDVIRRAEKEIEFCEHSHPDDARFRSTGYALRLQASVDLMSLC
jgi:hypothetical protein